MADYASIGRDPGFILDGRDESPTNETVAIDTPVMLGGRDESPTNETVAIDISFMLGERDENPVPSASGRNQCEEEV